MKIYICSSWRNEHYEQIVGLVRDEGHEVWNWREPPTGGGGFSWRDVPEASGWRQGDKWDARHWRAVLRHSVAQAGFASDLCGMNWCDRAVLLHPCGRSAHLEAGWIAGRGKAVDVLALEPVEPDLMVLALNGKIFGSVTELLADLQST